MSVLLNEERRTLRLKIPWVNGHPREECTTKALKHSSTDKHRCQHGILQYLETVLGLFWRFATSFSAQASLSRRLIHYIRQSFELCCRKFCSACTATLSFGATLVALSNRNEI